MKRTLVVFGVPFLLIIYSLLYLNFNIVIVGAIIYTTLNYLNYKNKTMLVTIIISIVFAFNTFLQYQSSSMFPTNDFDKVKGNITAKVLDKSPSTTSNSIGYTIEILDSDIPNLPTNFNGILYAEFNVFVDYYDIISVDVTCSHITNTQSFDFSSYYKSIGILMQFYSYSTPEILQSTSDNIDNYVFYKAKYLNEYLGSILDKYFSSYYAGMLKAILLGDDTYLDDILRLNSSRAGVSHIFVVSGLHIALLIGLFNQLFELIRFKIPLSIKHLLLIILVWIFVILTGFNISTVRAGIMITFMLIAPVFNRTNDTLNSLFGAGIIIIANNPFAIASLSFQLSFSATLGIALLSKIVKNFLFDIFPIKFKDNKQAPTFVKFILSSLSVTISSTIGMFPVLLIVFKGVSIISLIANLCIVSFLPTILVLSIVLLISHNFRQFAGLVKSILLILLYVVKELTHFFANLKYSYLGLNFSTIHYLILSVCIIVFLIITFKLYNRKVIRKTIKSFMLIFIVMVLVTSYIINYNVLTLTIFSDSSGTSIVLSNKGKANIINIKDNTRLDIDIANYLLSKNITQVNNYVHLTDRILVSDMQQLHEVAKISNIVTPQPNSKYSIFYGGDNYLDIIYSDMPYIKGNISGLDILITQDIENIQKYDILLIDTTQDIPKIEGKYIIDLNEFSTERKVIKFSI